jgi:hypothetical protein
MNRCVDEGSFSLAAERLSLPKTSVSRRVAAWKRSWVSYLWCTSAEVIDRRGSSPLGPQIGGEGGPVRFGVKQIARK